MSEEDVRKAVEPLILEYFENSDSMEVLFTLQEMLPNLGMKGIISTHKKYLVYKLDLWIVFLHLHLPFFHEIIVILLLLYFRSSTLDGCNYHCGASHGSQTFSS